MVLPQLVSVHALKLTRSVVALAAASLTVAGCSSAEDASSSASPETVTATTAPLSLVVIGDSIPFNSPQDCPSCTGFVDQYADALAEATGREVTTSNLSQHTGLTLPELMTGLPDLEGELAAADAIIIGIAHNSFPLNDDAPCGSALDEAASTLQDWSKVGPECAAQASTTYGPVYDELFSTVTGWRADKPTILLTLNRYNDWIGWQPANLTPEQADKTVTLHDAWNTMLCDSAQENGFACIDVYHAFNGPDGSAASGGLLAPDYVHPSQQGNDEITRLLTEHGFDALH